MFQESSDLGLMEPINEAEEKALEEAKEAKARLPYSRDFKELYENLEKIVIIENGDGTEKTFAELIDLIGKVRKNEADIDTITRGFELRETVRKLLEEEKNRAN